MSYLDFEAFAQLNEEDQKAVFKTMVDNLKTLDDVTAERDSFKNENESLIKTNTEKSEELKKTKELNFTLSRKINVEENRESAEDILHKMFI